MKTEMSSRVVVVIGRQGALPPLISPGGDREVLLLALGPLPTQEQRRAVEEAIGLAVERRIALEARIATHAEVTAELARVAGADTVRLLGLSRRDRRALGVPRNRLDR